MKSLKLGSKALKDRAIAAATLLLKAERDKKHPDKEFVTALTNKLWEWQGGEAKWTEDTKGATKRMVAACAAGAAGIDKLPSSKKAPPGTYVLLDSIKIPRKQAKLPMVISINPKTGKSTVLGGKGRKNALKRDLDAKMAEGRRTGTQVGHRTILAAKDWKGGKVFTHMPAVGRRVHHDIFGAGTVQWHVASKKGPPYAINIHFDAYGARELVWAFCQGKVRTLVKVKPAMLTPGQSRRAIEAEAMGGDPREVKPAAKKRAPRAINRAAETGGEYGGDIGGR